MGCCEHCSQERPQEMEDRLRQSIHKYRDDTQEKIGELELRLAGHGQTQAVSVERIDKLEAWLARVSNIANGLREWKSGMEQRMTYVTQQFDGVSRSLGHAAKEREEMTGAIRKLQLAVGSSRVKTGIMWSVMVFIAVTGGELLIKAILK
jgi:hypothetical protein